MNPSNEHADSVFYGAAVEEIQAGIIDKGLMGKAIAKSKGNRKEAEALYLEWRVELLKEEAVQELERREAQKKAKLKEEEERKRREAEEIKEDLKAFISPTESSDDEVAVGRVIFFVGAIIIFCLFIGIAIGR